VAVAEDENGQVDLYAQLQQATGRYVRVSMTRFNAGWYRLAELEVYTSDSDCSALPTATSEAPVGAGPGWQLFPNPAKAWVRYTLDEPGSAPIDVVIYDLQGRVVYQQRHAPQEGVLRPLLPAGAYLARLRTARGWLPPRQLVWLGEP
jgi:hypothetical protein